MSRPRRPFGPNQPGRLPATMLRVLAAEVSDPNRLGRGKRYSSEGAVTDVEIDPGLVTATVQGSRREPYVVTLSVRPGNGIPTRRELRVRCTCPDDAGTGSDACKHAVAAMFALADEFEIEPALIASWRGGAATRADEHDDEHGDDHDEPRSSGRLADVIELRPSVRPGATHVTPDPEPSAGDRTVVDQIGSMLGAPNGAAAPQLPTPDPIAHPPTRHALVDQVLADAIDFLRTSL